MKYSLVAVSGGSDSMALLDMLRKENKNLIVCHVNYGFRESAYRDEEIVRKYCDKFHLRLEILKDIRYDNNDGNLENFARVLRYNFFRENYKKYECDYLYVGHNLDDLLETYFIQIDRNGKCDFYGLKEETYMYEMVVKRVLLNYSKNELTDYCINNGVDFGVDETNFDDKYLRNKIRHNIIGKMTKEDKIRLLKKINLLNLDKEKEYKRMHSLLDNCKSGNNIVDLSKFNELDKDDRVGVLYYFIIENVKVKISISNSRINDILKKIDSTKPNIVLGEFEGYFLYKEYKRLVIKRKSCEFSYIVENLESDVGEFLLAKEGKKLERIIVSRNDFPLVIENYDGSNKEINRLFIEKKVPLSDRKSWPVVKDKLGKVLLVLNMKKFYNNKDSNSDELIEFYIIKKEKENCE